MSMQNSAAFTFPCPVCRKPVPLGAKQCPNPNCKEDLSALAIIDAVGEELYQTALGRIREGKLAEAIQILIAACVYSPQKIDNWVVLGKLRAQTGHYEEAIHYWEQALALQPDEPRSLAGINQAKHILQGRKLGHIAIPVIVALLIFFVGLIVWPTIFRLLPLAAITPAKTMVLSPTQIFSPTQTTSPSPTQVSSPTPSPTQTTPPSPTQVSSPTPMLITCTVSVPLNVRREPGLDNPLIGWLSKDEQVIVLSSRDIQENYRWLFIFREPDLAGWIYSEYCK